MDDHLLVVSVVSFLVLKSKINFGILCVLDKNFTYDLMSKMVYSLPLVKYWNKKDKHQVIFL